MLSVFLNVFSYFFQLRSSPWACGPQEAEYPWVGSKWTRVTRTYSAWPRRYKHGASILQWRWSLKWRNFDVPSGQIPDQWNLWDTFRCITVVHDSWGISRTSPSIKEWVFESISASPVKLSSREKWKEALGPVVRSPISLIPDSPNFPGNLLYSMRQILHQIASIAIYWAGIKPPGVFLVCVFAVCWLRFREEEFR